MKYEAYKKLTDEVKAALLEAVHSRDVKQLIEKTKEATDAGSFEVVISTADLDRQGEVIDLAGWDLTHYKTNPVVLWGHDYYSLPIGLCEDISVQDGKLVARGKFAPAEVNPFAQQVRKAYDLKIVRATSVGLIAREVNGNHITKAELLEFSFVPVPANPFALSLDKAKELGIDLEMLKMKGLKIKILTDEEHCCECGIALTAENAKERATDKPDTQALVCAACFEKTKQSEPKVKTPACRQDGETKEECMSRKIPEILKENPDMEQDQAVAIAANMCETACEAKAKGAVESQVQEADEWELKWQNLDKIFTIVDAFIEVYLNKETAVDKFNELLSETIELLKGLLPQSTFASSVTVAAVLKTAKARKFLLRCKDVEQIGAELTAMQNECDNAMVTHAQKIIEIAQSYEQPEGEKGTTKEQPTAAAPTPQDGSAGKDGEQPKADAPQNERPNTAGVEAAITKLDELIMVRALLRQFNTQTALALERMNKKVRAKAKRN